MHNLPEWVHLSVCVCGGGVEPLVIYFVDTRTIKHACESVWGRSANPPIFAPVQMKLKVLILNG